MGPGGERLSSEEERERLRKALAPQPRSAPCSTSPHVLSIPTRAPTAAHAAECATVEYATVEYAFTVVGSTWGFARVA